MECFVLGSGGMMPMPRRRLTALAVRRQGRVYLFDCGEGTQVPYKELHLGQRALDLVAITHLHADHVLGLPGMLMLRAQMPDPAPLTVLGPPGLGRFIDDCRRDLAMYINYDIRVRHWRRGADDLAFEDDQLKLFWRPVKHSVFCLGYRIEEHTRPGRFDPDAAVAAGVARGPMWGALQRGETVTLDDGTEVEPSAVLGPPRRGLKVGFVTDTAVCANLEWLVRDTDLAVVEGMFLGEHEGDAADKKHMTVGQSAAAARRAGARRLALVHISPRYTFEHLPRIEAEARAEHPGAEVARDGQVFELFPPDE